MQPDLNAPQAAAVPLPELRHAQLLLAQMVLVPCATATLLFVPLPFSVALLAVAYGLLVVVERRCGIANPVTRMLAAVSLLVLLLALSPATQPDTPLLLLLYYGSLLATALLQRVGDRPAAFGLASSRSAGALQRRTALLWTLVPAVGTGIVLLQMMPAAGLAWLSPRMLTTLLALLPVGASLLTLWMHFIAGGGKDVPFTSGEYRFGQLPSNADALLPFYRHFIREALPSIRQGMAPELDTPEAWVQLKMSLDRESWPHTQFFVALHQGVIVGTISCTLKQPGVTLGFENGHTNPLSVRRLLPYGGVMEVGRLSVSGPHRFGRSVLQGLLRCALARALQADAAFLVTQSYLSARSVYRKIGFFALDERVSYQLGLGVAIETMAFNLCARVMCGPGQADGTIADGLSPSAAERYFKRQAARALVSNAHAWALPDAEVVALLAAARSPADGGQEVDIHAG